MNVKQVYAQLDNLENKFRGQIISEEECEKLTYKMEKLIDTAKFCKKRSYYSEEEIDQSLQKIHDYISTEMGLELIDFEFSGYKDGMMKITISKNRNGTCVTMGMEHM